MNDMDQIEGPWSPEEDKMLQNLAAIFGVDWSLISKSLPGRTVNSCLSRWISLCRTFTSDEGDEKHGVTSCSLLTWKGISLTSEDITNIGAHNINIPSLSSNDINRGQGDSFSHALNLSLALGGLSCQAPSIGDMARDNVSQPSGGRPQQELKKGTLQLTKDLYCMTSEGTHNINIPPTTSGDINHGQGNSYIHDLNLSLKVGSVSSQALSIGDMARDNVSQPSGGYNSMPTLKRLLPFSWHVRPQQELKKRAVLDKQKIFITATSETLWNLNTKEDQGNSRFHSDMETGSENSIHQGNSSHQAGGVNSGQPPSISDIVRENMSSGGQHSYSHDHSAPSWNALNKRDSSPTMIDSDYVQESVGDKFGWNDFSEVSSKYSTGNGMVTNDY